MTTIGIALGGGGAKGLAHVVLLEAFEELGVRPACVAATSIGAIIGVLYCSGFPAREMRSELTGMSFSEEDVTRSLSRIKGILKWFDFVNPGRDRGGLLSAEGFMAFLLERVRQRSFGELETPLRVVACDFWKRQEVVMDAGELMPAVQASMSLPGIFAPVVLGDRVLVDGGAVNPVPYDRLPETCDFRIAIDVIGRRSEAIDKKPSLNDAVFNTFQIMEKSIIRQKLENSPPDLYLEPNIVNVRILEFFKAEHVFRQALPAKERLKRELGARLEQL